MKAAVVTTFSEPPRFADFAEPVAGPGEEVVEVVASGLHPRVRSQASGSHYTSTDELPLVPGVDGVGRLADGSLVYFVLPDTAFGAMAERTVIDPRRSVPVPAGADPVLVASAMNPAMSSWIALRGRIAFEPGQSVLILGATGSAGRLAIQVARHLGAASIVAAGRGASRLAELSALGATATVDLAAAPDDVAAALSATAAEVDVVLDYLWGEPAQNAIMPLITGRADRSRLLQWIQIGAVAGPEIILPSAVLRQANVQFLGSGQGSASARGILEQLPSLVAELVRGTFTVDALATPLADVARAWTEPLARSTQRVVLVP
ncbi:quinone oxidoreductase [Frondihabitans sp. PAMC 28766]|uniref:quinone oxidoreductase family protein n=1 Tax=Frondihabitans sp. PAMC 28766 TaxID=1795630 RepID=UPI00078DE0C5|nr:zinc-binding alcohol dehydrogenase family protein [Frondihabitans sp. PAMC 28766]AMM21958.1 quinone oxidoreductase [Frondihabitans sp. PAMC 28766]